MGECGRWYLDTLLSPKSCPCPGEDKSKDGVAVRPAGISTHFDVTWLICPAQRFYEQPLSYKYGIGDGAEWE